MFDKLRQKIQGIKNAQVETKARNIMVEFCLGESGRSVDGLMEDGQLAWTLTNNGSQLDVTQGPAFERAKQETISTINFLNPDKSIYRAPEKEEFAQFRS